jgi:serine/threonine-protein kinase
MAPEQSKSTASVDRRADVYAFGVLLYEMTTGRVPLEASTLYEAVVKHATVRPRGVRELRRDVSEAVEAVVMRCLEKDPAARFATCADVWAAWSAARAGSPVAARARRPRTRAIAVGIAVLLAGAILWAVSRPSAAITAASTSTPASTSASTPATASTIVPTPTSTSVPPSPDPRSPDPASAAPAAPDPSRSAAPPSPRPSSARTGARRARRDPDVDRAVDELLPR